MFNSAGDVKTAKIVLIFGLIMVVGLFINDVVHALRRTSYVNLSFTFNPMLAIALSSDNITIPNLAPGSAASSDTFTINVLTNNASGYTLNASVGNSTTYNTRSLIHQNPSVSNSFAPYESSGILGASSPANMDPDTWAVSKGNKMQNILTGSTTISFINYRSLPLYSDTENVYVLAQSDDPANNVSGDEVYLKIGAKASETQAAGEYNNVINFELVANPLLVTFPVAYANAGKEKVDGYYTMQDMNEVICDAVEVIDEASQTQLIDTRGGR